MNRAWPVFAVVLIAAFASGCGGADTPAGSSDAPPSASSSDAPDSSAASNDTPAGQAGAPTASPAFDRERARAEARALIGLQEDEVTERAELRIVRRGDESRPVTMDLRPGRKNVELDDDGTGTFVVTRVVVEVPDGQDSLVVE